MAIAIPQIVIPFMLTAPHTARWHPRHDGAVASSRPSALDIVNPMAWLTRVEFRCERGAADGGPAEQQQGGAGGLSRLGTGRAPIPQGHIYITW